MPYLGIFGRQFKKTVIIFEITALECLKFQNFMQNKKIFKLGPKKWKNRNSLYLELICYLSVTYLN